MVPGVQSVTSATAVRASRGLRWIAGAVGAALAIAFAGLAGTLTAPAHAALPWLVASMGATAILVFLLPASPLSQPWPVAGGHLLAAAVGLLANHLAVEPWLAGGLALGLAAGAMLAARCLHPPAGGTALITALALPGSAASHLSFLLSPLVLNIGVILAWAALWHRWTGHSYPHRAAPAPILSPWVGHIEDGDLDAVLADWDEELDVSREDLLALLHAVEARVLARAGGRTTG